MTDFLWATSIQQVFNSPNNFRIISNTRIKMTVTYLMCLSKSLWTIQPFLMNTFRIPMAWSLSMIKCKHRKLWFARNHLSLPRRLRRSLHSKPKMGSNSLIITCLGPTPTCRHWSQMVQVSIIMGSVMWGHNRRQVPMQSPIRGPRVLWGRTTRHFWVTILMEITIIRIY